MDAELAVEVVRLLASQGVVFDTMTAVQADAITVVLHDRDMWQRRCEEEREECARIADAEVEGNCPENARYEIGAYGWYKCAKRIAAEIRARTLKKKENGHGR